jgi:hypothetical protein
MSRMADIERFGTVAQDYARHLGFRRLRPIIGEMAQHASPASASTLTEGEIAYLECERDHWGPSGHKERIVVERFGVSLPVFYQRLYRICESDAAWQYDPALIRHIRDVADDLTSRRLNRGEARG